MWGSGIGSRARSRQVKPEVAGKHKLYGAFDASRRSQVASSDRHEKAARRAHDPDALLKTVLELPTCSAQRAHIFILLWSISILPLPSVGLAASGPGAPTPSTLNVTVTLPAFWKANVIETLSPCFNGCLRSVSIRW